MTPPLVAAYRERDRDGPCVCAPRLHPDIAVLREHERDRLLTLVTEWAARTLDADSGGPGPAGWIGTLPPDARAELDAWFDVPKARALQFRTARNAQGA